MYLIFFAETGEMSERREKGISFLSLASCPASLIIAWHYSLGAVDIMLLASCAPLSAHPCFARALAAARKRFICVHFLRVHRRRIVCRASTKSRKEAMKVNFPAALFRAT
jgi:hypothetical protein